MPKLIVYHDDVLDRELELGEKTLRIGRSDDNEIILTDPTKSLSRHHAELRVEQGTYSVVDSNSQNGVWVAGRRVQTTQLEPGVPVVIGSYKLVLKEERPPAPAVGEATVFNPNWQDPSKTVLMPWPPAAERQPAAPSAPNAERPKAIPAPAPSPAAAAPAIVPKPAEAVSKPAPKPEAAAPSAGPAAPAPPTPAPKAAPVAPSAEPAAPAPPKPAPKPDPPAPVPAPAAAAPPAAAAQASKPAKKRTSKIVVFGGIAALLVTSTTAIVFLTPLRSRLARLMGWSPAAEIAAVPPAAAPAADPPPKAPAPAPAPEPPPPPVARKAEPPSKPLPVNALKPVPEPPVKPPPAVPAVTEKPVEKPVIPDLTGAFEEARAAIIKGDYLAAIAGFESILKTDPNYPNAANLLSVARGGAKNASQLAVDSGNKAELRSDYASAMAQYERALQLDAQSTSAPDAIRRLKARMQREGEDLFARAQQFDAVGRAQDAIAAFERTVQLLPADHPSAKISRDRLAVLKR